jgi:hypothetical protein
LYIYGREDYIMITEVAEKRVLSLKDINTEFDGHWVLLNHRAFPPSEGKGYLVAYGDGTPQDRDALEQIVWDKYDGKALLLKGYTPKEDIIYGIYQC